LSSEGVKIVQKAGFSGPSVMMPRQIVANQLRNAVQTDTCGLLHACFIVFVVVIVDGDLNHVLEHEINQIFVVLPNMSLAWLLLLLASDFDFCERGPELDSLQTH
jgi:hypothetical protein